MFQRSTREKEFDKRHFISLVSQGNFSEANEYLNKKFQATHSGTPLFNVDQVLSFVEASCLLNTIEDLVLEEEQASGKKEICDALHAVIKKVWLDRHAKNLPDAPLREKREYADFAMIRNGEYDAAVGLLCWVYRECVALNYPEFELENVRGKLCRCITLKTKAASQSTAGESKHEPARSLSSDDKKNISKQALELISADSSNETIANFFQAAVYIVADQKIDEDHLINGFMERYAAISSLPKDVELFILKILQGHFQKLESSLQCEDESTDSCVKVMGKTFNEWNKQVDESICALTKPAESNCVVS